MTRSLLHSAAPALFITALVGGCSGAASSGAPAQAKTTMQAAPAKANGSGVAVQYRLDGTPQVGQATTVVLSFGNVTAADGARLRIAPDGDIVVQGASPEELPAGQVTTYSLQVVPGSEGIGYLNVFTTQNGATSATSIAVQTGKTPAGVPAAGTLKSTPAGEKIISLPAR